MKTTSLLAIVAAVGLTFAGRAQAGEPALSPKAAQLRYDFRTVPGTTSDMIDRSVKAGAPKALALAHELRKVPSTGPSIDLAHGPRPLLSPKDPRYDQELRRLQEVQIAPLK
jgi:hypothetical protein